MAGEAMIRRIPLFRFGTPLNLLLIGGAAYFAWEHEQGRHERSNLLCLTCWLNKVPPAPEAPGGAGESEAPGGSGESEPPEES